MAKQNTPGYFTLYSPEGKCINVTWYASEAALRAVVLPGVRVERVSYGPSIEPRLEPRAD